MNDALSSIFVDLAIVDVSPIDAASKLSWLWIKLRQPSEDGLSTDPEFHDLCKYEDEISLHLNEKISVHYVGRITGSGRREFYFYSDETTDVRELLEPVVAAHPEYLFQFGSRSDATWSQYHTLLYPGPSGMEQIRARTETEAGRR